MAGHPQPAQQPLPVEVPIGLFFACLAVGGLCSLAPFEDRFVLAGGFWTVGTAALAAGLTLRCLASRPKPAG